MMSFNQKQHKHDLSACFSVTDAFGYIRRFLITSGAPQKKQIMGKTPYFPGVSTTPFTITCVVIDKTTSHLDAREYRFSRKS
jgi:hypothetical protein